MNRIGMRKTKAVWVTLLSFFLAIFSSGRAAASPELRKALGELAETVKKVLDGEQEETIAVGDFSGPGNFPTASGPEIRQILTEELEKRKVAVKIRAKFGVKGAYSQAELPAANADDARIGKKVLGVRLTASVVDSFDKPLGNLNFERLIHGEATILELMPVDVSLPAKGREVERDAELRKAYVKPSPVLQGSVVRGKSGQYGMEILVQAQPRPAVIKDDLAFVEIQRGESYAVRLINDSDVEAAVQLRIDGLSMFAFSEIRFQEGPRRGQPRYTVVFVPAHKSFVVPGWHVNNDKSDQFLVTQYAESAAARLQQTADIGTLSAVFQAAWEQGSTPPADEPGKNRGPGSGDATGFGQRVDQKYKEVKRELGVIRDSISVRYTRPR